MPSTWQNVRVFISSTFRDMHAERDHLVKRVFPALRERLQKYRIHLVDVDLRWGITEEESEKDQVLDLCLQQIDECRPFFVGILGERYGWVPEAFTEEAASRYGWVQYHTGKSVTELEIVHGVLNDPQMHGHGMFFFRDPAFTEDVPEEKQADLRAENESSAEKLAALKQAIRDTPLPFQPFDGYPCQYAGMRINWQLASRELKNQADREALHKVAEDGIVDPDEYARLGDHLRELVHRFGVVQLTGLEEFGQQVSDQLWQAIKAEHDLPDTPPTVTLAATDPLAEEAAYHEEFMESRLRVYVGREEVQNRLMTYVEGDATHPCLVTGRSGSGKSAALARFARRYADGHPDALLIPHFVGASPGSTSLHQMLRRFCLVLQQRFGPADDVPYDVSELVNRFRQALDSVPADARVVLVIDAVNQLDETDDAHSMSWLPWELPPQVKLVISCIDDTPETGTGSERNEVPVPLSGTEHSEPVLQSLAPRPLERLEIGSLSGDERLEIANHVPALSAKKLDPQQVGLLLSNPATENPLFLLVALEELRGFGSYEQVADRIAAFPHEDGNPVAALFGQVIERLRQEFDPDVVRTILALIASSRSGMSERELSEMIEGIGVEKSTGDLFSVLRQLRPYLQRRGELLDFFHRGLYKAVRQRYLPDDASRVPYHRDLAEYFHVKANPLGQRSWSGDCPRALSELPHHQIWGRLWKPLEATLTSLLFVEAKCRCGFVFDLQTDYREALAALPEMQEQIASDRCRQERIAAWTAGLIDYASRWNERRDCPQRGESVIETVPTLPEPVPVCQMWSDEEIQAEYRRFIEQPTRLDGMRAFAAFATSQCYPLLDHGKQSGFVLQHAANSALAGPVYKAATSLLPALNVPYILRRWPADAVHTPRPALLRTLEGHSDGVLGVSVTPDGRRAVSASHDNTLRVWDLERGVCLRTLEGHVGGVFVVSMTPDGRCAVSGSEDTTLRVWDLENGACLRTLEKHGWTVCGASVTPDGRRAVSAGRDYMVGVWDLESGECLRGLKGHSNPVNAVSLTPDGRRAVSASSDHTLRVWDLENGVCLRTLKGHSDGVESVSVTPDGRRAVSASSDHTLRVWDLENGECLRTLEGHSDEVESVSVTPDGRRAVSASSDHTLRVWDLESGVCMRTLEGHSNGVKSVSVTPDGRRAVSASRDKTLRVWDLESGVCLRTLEGHSNGVESMSVTPDGRRAVSAGGLRDKILRVWDPKNGVCLRTLEGHSNGVKSVSVTPDGRRAVSASRDKTLRVWDLENGECLRTLEGHSAGVESVSVTPDGRRAVSASSDHTLRVWDLESGVCLRTLEEHSDLEKHSDVVGSVSVTPDGRRAVSAGSDYTLRVWDLESGMCLWTLEGHRGFVTSVSVTPDGRWAISANYDNTLRVWDLERGVCLRTLEGHSESVYGVSVTPDGRRAVSASRDKTLRVWDLENGECLRTLEGHSAGVESVSVTPDGRRAVSASRDKTLRVWDLESGVCLAVFSAAVPLRALCLSATGHVATAGPDTGEVVFLSLQIQPWPRQHGAVSGRDERSAAALRAART